MARGKKVIDETTGVIGLVEFNPEIMEDGSKTPHIPIDQYAGIYVDADNFELVKVKQTTVSEDNIKSVSNVYGEKYKIGDTFQEWISMGKYLSSPEMAVECYSNLRFKDEISKKRYREFEELTKIKREIKDDINRVLGEKVVPAMAYKIGEAYKELQVINKNIDEIHKVEAEALKECNYIINVAKEKYTTMVAKGLIDKKKVQHKVKEEE